MHLYIQVLYVISEFTEAGLLDDLHGTTNGSVLRDPLLLF